MGCEYCYARKIAERFGGWTWVVDGEADTLHDKLPERKNMWYGMSVTKKSDTHTAEAITQDLPS